MVSLRLAYAAALALFALALSALWLAGFRQVDTLAFGVAALVIVYGAFREGVRHGRRGAGGAAK